MMFGILPVDKPAGMTSRDVVNHVQRLLGKLRVKLGHTGTLDPMATGVLLVCVGPATRLTEIAHQARKHYTATFELDVHSPTLDADSTVQVVDSPVRPDKASWIAAGKHFVGKITQIPPAYSAVQISGQRAYHLARQGKTVDLPSREVTIYELRTRRFEYPFVEIDVVCSTGTYIRTLGDDIAKRLGTRAVMRALRRTRIGAIDADDCVPLEAIDSLARVRQNLLPPTVLLADMLQITVDPETARRIAHGQRIRIDHIRPSGAPSGARTQRVVDSPGCEAGSRLSEDSMFKEARGSHDQVNPPRASASDWQEAIRTLPEMLAALNARGNLVALLRRCHGRTYRPAMVFPSAQAATHPSKTNMPHNPESW